MSEPTASDTSSSGISDSDAARLRESGIAEAESIQTDEVDRSEELGGAGTPDRVPGDADGLPEDDSEVLDHNLMKDAETPAPNTDAGAIADEEGWAAATSPEE